jgi:hypothetical protein
VIEYDTDGNAFEDEKAQWLKGHVDVLDIVAAQEQGDTDAKVTFTEM